MTPRGGGHGVVVIGVGLGRWQDEAVMEGCEKSSPLELEVGDLGESPGHECVNGCGRQEAIASPVIIRATAHAASAEERNPARQRQL